MPLLSLSLLAAIAFVPLDDRPVNAEFPIMLGQIAGVSVEAPPRELLGNFLNAGRPDAIAAWLKHAVSHNINATIVSSDMLAYGGLVASRVPGASYVDTSARLANLAQIRDEIPGLWVSVFGTLMRLAPTSVPSNTDFFAAYPVWKYLDQYANLTDPPIPSEALSARKLRTQIGSAALNAYLATRARNLAIDQLLIKMTHDGTIDLLVIGQDDAGSQGLHIKELRALRTDLSSGSQLRASIKPGADDLGMVLVANALARDAKWMPRIAVRYSRPDGALFRDPLEYEPISNVIKSLISACGGVYDEDQPDVVLYVRVPDTSGGKDGGFLAGMARDIAAGRSVALADLSFITSYHEQAVFARSILASHLASHLDAYASWNTDANTVGTALAEAIAAAVGRREGTYNLLAHRTFTFIRFLDDYVFHDEIRPNVSLALAARGIRDDEPLEPRLLASVTTDCSAQLRWFAKRVLAELYPDYHLESMSVTLPWGRIFEVAIKATIGANQPIPLPTKQPMNQRYGSN